MQIKHLKLTESENGNVIENINMSISDEEDYSISDIMLRKKDQLNSSVDKSTDSDTDVDEDEVIIIKKNKKPKSTRKTRIKRESVKLTTSKPVKRQRKTKSLPVTFSEQNEEDDENIIINLPKVINTATSHTFNILNKWKV